MSQAFTLPLALVVIGLIFFVYRARLRHLTRSSGNRFHAHEDQFIYQPWGRFGSAYLVSADARDEITLRTHTLLRLIFPALGITAIGPMVLLGADYESFAHLQQWLPLARIISVVVILAAAIFLWRRNVRPLYADAPPAPHRLTVAQLRDKTALITPWATIIRRLFLCLVAAATGIYLLAVPAMPDSPNLLPMGIVLIAVALLIGRSAVNLALSKRRQTNTEVAA